MIYASFTNSPSAIQGKIDQGAVTAAFVAKYPGFPGYVYANPDQPSSTGDGMGYPYDIYGPTWKSACSAAKAAGGILLPRIGGCATHDLPPNDGVIATLMDRFRPSSAILADYGSGPDVEKETTRYRLAAQANGQVYAPEANAKRAWLTPGPNLWIVAQWYMWGVPVTGAVVVDSERRWKIAEVLATGAKVVVEVNMIERDGSGFTDGCPDWAAARVALAKQFHAIDPKNVIVSVRMTGMSGAQVAELRACNA